MEPPSSSQSDGLLPQDLSKCSLPCALNLTRKGEENLLKSTSMEALRVVKTPNWYSIGPGGSRGLMYAENESDHVSQPNQRVQPNDAFSNATVTLSYVSRSCVFSSPESISQLPPICGVSSMNRKLSQHSPPRETNALSNETVRGGLSVDIDQCFLQQTKPLALVSQPEAHEKCAQAQVVESRAGDCFMQQTVEVNGNKGTYPVDAEKLEPSLGDSPLECTRSQEMDGYVHNGTTSSHSDLGLYKEKSTGSPNTDNGAERENCDSEVVFLISKTNEPVILLDNGGSRNLCNPLNGEYVSPLEDPLSPPATSLDETEDVFVLPQTLSSPTGDNSIDDVSDITAEEEPGDLSVGEFVMEPVKVESSVQSCYHSTNDVEMPIASNGIQTLPADVPEPCKPLLESDGGLLECETKPSDFQEDKSVVPDDSVFSGDVLLQDRTLQKKKLPPRSRRGTRLEAIVQNITPSRCKLSTNIHSIKKCCSPKANAETIQPENLEVLQSHDSAEDVSGSEKEPSLEGTVLGKENASNTDTDSNKSKNSTSDSENTNTFKALYSNAYPEPLRHNKTEKEEIDRTPPKRSLRSKAQEVLPMSKECQKSPTKQHTASSANKAVPTAKKAQVTKRKRKKRKAGQSSLFSPQEPEIKLKYVNYKEEKRDAKADTFSPFIRMEVKEFSTCTVINYAEEENARLRKGQQQVTSGFISGIIPTTSCFQLGRVSSESKWQSSLVCCLCGRSANALDLGDLHGPYYPEGHKPAPKALSSLQSLKEEEDYSDSDSSCGLHSRKSAQAAHSCPQRPSHRLKREDVLGACCRWTADAEGLQSPSAKRPRTELVTDDWYSPPVVPLDTNEYWIHEDCGIWSAGVYLVRGKLYGLEEAIRLAQETVCSTCQRRGATLGCFFKGCPNKYHYNCALQSDCVLNEENFSMKCTKHKNKSFKGSSVNKGETR